VKADEIMQVLRLTAMGRVNHPDQQRLCEALEKLLAEPVALPVVEMPVWIGSEGDSQAVDPNAEATVADLSTTARIKRGPGRPKKAE
jgi:hypothetical protein